MENIRLAKVRDLGQTIGDPFLFARHNFKLLFRAYLYYAVPPLVVAVGLMAFGFKSIFSTISHEGRHQLGSGFSNLGAALGLGYILFILISLFQQLYISEFMILKEDREDVSNNDVLARIKSDWKNIAGTFLFLFFIGGLAITFIFLVLASSAYVGAYVSGFTVFLLYLFLLYAIIPLSNLIFIRLRERQGIFAALAQSFRITAGNWWKSFIAFFIVFIIFYSLILLLLIPFYIMVAVASYHATSMGVAPNLSDIYLNPVMGIILTLTTFVTFFVQNVVNIFVGINYFSLSEKYSNFHLRKEISQIGVREDKNVHRQEGEY